MKKRSKTSELRENALYMTSGAIEADLKLLMARFRAAAEGDASLTLGPNEVKLILTAFAILTWEDV